MVVLKNKGVWFLFMNKVRAVFGGFYSIKTKMIGVMLLLVVFSVVVVKSYDYSQRVPELEKAMREERVNSAVITASRLETEISKAVAALEISTRNASFVSGDKDVIVKSLQGIKQSNPLYSTVFMLDSSLNRLTDDGQTGSLASREYVQEVKKSQKTTISKDVFISKADNKLVIAIISPVKVAGAPESYIGLAISVDSLQDITQKEKENDSNYVFAIDAKDGMVFSHPVKEYVGSLKLINTDGKDEAKVAVDLRNLAKEAVSGKTGSTIYEFNGSKVIAAYTVIPGTSYGVISRMNYYDAMGPVRHERNSAIFITLLISLASGVLTYFFARIVVLPIIAVAKQAEVIASGDFTISGSGQGTSNDEVGQLQVAFHKMSLMLTSIMGQIGQASEQLAASSQELTASAEESTLGANQVAKTVLDVATGAMEQVRAVRSTLEGIHQVSDAIRDIAHNASDVSGISEAMSTLAIDGERSIQSAIRAMAEINSTVQETAKDIDHLGVASTEIGEIVEAIGAIAGQTNLLALNAAIEAARAGEHGRGFSVVADEIRKLAEQSKGATNRIATIIGGVQSQTRDAIGKMDESVLKVAMGQEVVVAAGTAFEIIKEHIEKVNDSVQGITAATEELSASSDEIVVTVEKIKVISEETETNSHTISASAQEQSASMEEVVGFVEKLTVLATELDGTLKQYKF